MKCQYCQTDRSDAELITVQIVERDNGWVKGSFGRRRWGTVSVKRPYRVCKDHPCGMKLQMSREG